MNRYDQQMTALAKADEIRLGRADVKRKLRDHQITLGAALEKGCTQGMRLWDLLCAVKGYGPAKVEDRMMHLSIPLGARVRDVGASKRKWLVSDYQLCSRCGVRLTHTPTSPYCTACRDARKAAA